MKEHARSLIKRVRDVVSDHRQRTVASDVLQMCIMAMEQLAELDQTLYDYFANAKLSLTDHDELQAGITEATFVEVHAKTFRAIRKLCSYLHASGMLRHSERPSTLDNQGFDFGDDFDLCFEEASPAGAPTLEDLEIDEIDKAFEAIADEIPDSSTMLGLFREQLGTLGGVLTQQAETFDLRIAIAIERRNFELALRELDASRQALGDGIFAMASTVFEIFGVNVERSDLVPSYKNTLEQSLELRKALSELSQLVTSENDWVIKDASMSAADVQEAIFRVADVLEQYVDGNVCKGMRAPERLELESFVRKIRKGPTEMAALACEGLAKYLESLSIVNQREVLVEHDKQVMIDIRHSLEAARSLLAISPTTARQLVKDGLSQAEKLRGRSPSLDERLDQWNECDCLSDDSHDLASTIDALDALLR
ncbi:MAG TPA: hypothetical protein PKL73_13740 [Polyangiaceae bacterium]|jgi:hypothetical protein|nr:MAG: hypothetical protein BWY17_03245 [Deltaproteobacteria bacterium ADurb.Bin207]HNS98008.1 hypothetical protein [Polyangiaceae bacterium]HNZ24778.1 hypothetical protein [Polyangiaceae bacterium]HOD25090.1 hypothetical protein [Polyangiaceae bacterium]HOE50521.1 hypothetical protein [Polyangiaceae bacterium]